MYSIIYPVKRTVSEEEMVIKAQDAYANGHTSEYTVDPDCAAEILEDCGLITLAGRISRYFHSDPENIYDTPSIRQSIEEDRV